MKIEKVNENQIRCTLTREDLASRELKISELAYGTELYVDGEKVSPSQAAAYAVREESPYMADYILGEQGKISQVRLDKVDLR